MKRAVWILLAAVLVGCSRPSAPSAGNGEVQVPAAEPEARGEAPALVNAPASVAKAETPPLFPAYLFAKEQRKWGYVDRTGKFVIPPTYDLAEAFSAEGLAMVASNGRYGLIDRNGNVVVKPEYDAAGSPTADGDRFFNKGETTVVVDARGKVVSVSVKLVDGFSEGLAPFVDNMGPAPRMGYVDRSGTVVIPPQFEHAAAFSGGKALVRVGGKLWALIDKTGKRLVELPYATVQRSADDLLLVADASWKHGYVAMDGQVVMPLQFGDARPFADGFAVVNRSGDFIKAEFGVINRQGKWVIPAEFGYIEALGEGLFAVARRSENYVPPAFMPMAIFNAQGQQLTEFRFYDVQKASQGLVSVSDEEQTYFLDAAGAKAKGLPVLAGAGTLKLMGDVVEADVDQTLSYLTRDGKPIWQADRSIPLQNGLTAKAQKFRPDRATLVYYPEVTGLPDAKVQGAINARLKAIFVEPHAQAAPPPGPGEEQIPEVSLTVTFSAEQLGKLLIVGEQGYAYPVGAAHGMPISNYYHFDLTTGKEYKLADLFQPGSAYAAKLTARVRAEIAKSPEQYLNKTPDVKPDQPFTVTKENLVIYFYPYEVASYAQGFMKFPVPWNELGDLLDMKGAFWGAFHSP